MNLTERRKAFNRMGLAAALLAVCSWIGIPGPVPFTLQTFGVFVVAGLLGGRKGTISVFVYILLGAIGVPVFSGGRGGLSVLFGETGGYIMGFLPMVFLCGKLYERKQSVGNMFCAMMVGLLLCYTMGVLWSMLVFFSFDLPSGLVTVVVKHIVPCIVPDIIKMTLAVFTIKKLKKYGI